VSEGAQLALSALATHHDRAAFTPFPVPRFASLLRATLETGPWALSAGWRTRTALAGGLDLLWSNLGEDYMLHAIGLTLLVAAKVRQRRGPMMTGSSIASGRSVRSLSALKTGRRQRARAVVVSRPSACLRLPCATVWPSRAWSISSRRSVHRQMARGCWWSIP
jgi:hypothetical protein